MGVQTEDGSMTLYSERFGEHYHSLYGATSESNHVFIEAAYLSIHIDPVSVLEIGFGTGLNAFLTAMQAETNQRFTHYEAIELYPVDFHTISSLSKNELFLRFHTEPWEKDIAMTSYFTLHKRKIDLLETAFTRGVDIIYFDAFSPAVQPEMWSNDVFSKLYDAMNPGAVLTTYCAKGEVRRTMQKVGYTVERLSGPKGKREMLRGRK